MEKTINYLASDHFTVFSKLASAESSPSISAHNGHFTQPPGKLIITCLKITVLKTASFMGQEQHRIVS